jgi:hypothetical protein
MITTIILYILSFILQTISGLSNFIANGFSIWPDNVINGLTYFFTALTNWDFILNTTEMLKAIKWSIYFDIVYVSIKLLLKLFNWIRGSGELDV